jgi:microcystin-dependent protein
MSRIELKGNISGTGTLTIESPNTNADSTIVLPANGGQMVAADPGTAGNVLVSTGTAWASQANPPEFVSGTVMMFGQTAAPTGWTKDTTNYNNSSLRVVTGTAGNGGSVDFTTAFASQTPAGSVSVDTSGLSAGATTLTTTQIPSHNHTLNTATNSGGSFIDPGSRTGNQGTYSSNNTGGGGSHSHSMSGSATATFTGTAINLAVKYVDVIRATKD